MGCGGSKKPAVTVDKPASSEYQKFKDAFQDLTKMESKAARKEEWKSCDTNGTGKVSLAEFDGWVLGVLKKKYAGDAEAIHDKFKGGFLWAYKDAKDVKPGDGNDDDWITWVEFRVSIAYLISYTGLFDAFISIDGGAGLTGKDDDRVTLEEFKKAASALKATEWIAFTDATVDGKEEELFKKINAEGEKVLFSELCHYAKKEEVAADTDLGKLLSKGEEDD